MKFSRKTTWFCACCAPGVSTGISAAMRLPWDARSTRTGRFGGLAFHGNRSLRSYMCGGAAYHDEDRLIFHFPTGFVFVPVGEGFGLERNLHCLCFLRLQCYAV